MSALTLKLLERTAGNLDLDGVIPETLAALPAKSRARLRVRHGRRQVALGDLFSIEGDDPSTVRLIGLHGSCHRVGRGMTSGTLEVHGSVGTELGREMRGGTLTVSGSAGDGAALGMRGGVLRIARNVGDGLGGPVPGATSGMNGGTVIVGGNAGARAGERMRRGLIVITGACGCAVGDRMIAGTVVVLGACGDQPGLGMRRGSILLAKPPETLPATFNACGEFELGMTVLLARDIAALSPVLGRRLGAFRRSARWCGDLSYGGRGELLVAVPARRG